MIVPRAGAASGIRRGVGTPAILLSIERRSRQPARAGRRGADDPPAPKRLPIQGEGGDSQNLKIS
jgi:hypothetical protein